MIFVSERDEKQGHGQREVDPYEENMVSQGIRRAPDA
jgi:hypothetical protein